MKTYSEKELKDALTEIHRKAYQDGFKHGVSVALNSIEPNHYAVVSAWREGKEIPVQP